MECERGAIVVDGHGRTNLPDVYAAGDATVSTDAVTGVRRPVALAGPANRAGRHIADAILRPERARAIPMPLGTAIVRIGELTAAMTGANCSPDAAGIRYHTLHLHPGQHAGYFPRGRTDPPHRAHPQERWARAGRLVPWAKMAWTSASTYSPPRFAPTWPRPISSIWISPMRRPMAVPAIQSTWWAWWPPTSWMVLWISGTPKTSHPLERSAHY